jgi:ABC-type polysaccharide/polyol phosphate transport system ATPase subunit
VDIPIFDIRRASLRKALLGRAIGGRFREAGSHITVTALKNVTLEAHDGDRIALVGNNGSGKSTLLRVMSKVYPPTSGTVKIVGSIAPMFDAGLGMNADATGLENIQIAGTIWGMTRAQIRNSIDDITEFTELGDFLRVPVRTYSSGMMMRLAFAIATSREPEILLIDEVISVGDASFIQKAFARLESFAARSRIVIIAAHNDIMLRRLCHKAIWLSDGRICEYGDIDTVFQKRQPASGLAPASAPQLEPAGV